MGIIDMNGNAICKPGHAVVGSAIMADDALNPSTGKEVLLPQSQLLAGCIGIVRIKNLCNLIDPFFLFQRKIGAGIDRCFSRPQTQVIHHLIVVPHHGHIVWYSQYIVSIVIGHP